MFEMMMSSGVVFIALKFFGCLGGEGAKNENNYTCYVSYLRNSKAHDHGF